MKPAQAIAATLGIGAICVTLTACDLADIGDAQTAAELAPSLEALREAVPEHHRRLADGTFDSLSILEQWDFVADVNKILRMRRYLKRRYLEAGPSGPADETIQQEVQPSESESASRESLVRLLESRKQMPPEYAEFSPFHSRFVLRELKRQDRLEQAMKSPIGWLLTWYLGKTDKPVQFEMQAVVGNGTCGGPHVLYYVGGGGSTGVEVVEVPPETQDCP